MSITLWALVPGYVVGWDLNVYRHAFDSIRAGRDPYLDGMAVQRVFHAHLAEHPKAPPPYTYVYSPVTLPLLHALLPLPLWLIGTVYWSLYALAIATVLWVCSRFAEPQERYLVALLAPAAVFFPGLLQQDVLFSGNVAYLLYGGAFAAALLGWRRGTWWPFYLVVLLASCFKAPLLILLAIPVLSARGQWAPTLLTAAAGVACFAGQPHIWPALFRHYLEAVELQFSYNHDFSSSPAGLLANALYSVVPYQITSGLFYLLYAATVGSTLLVLAQAYFAGHLARTRWLPLMLLGVALLNPRIMEYDVAPLTLPMLLVLWRAAGDGASLRRRSTRAGLIFAAANLFAAESWRLAECFLLVGVFSAGSVQLVRQTRKARAAAALAPMAPLRSVS